MTLAIVTTLPADSDTSSAVQLTGTALRISARITSGGPNVLALIRMNSTGKWYRATDQNGVQVELELTGVGNPGPDGTGLSGNTDFSFTLPAVGSNEWYGLLLDGGTAFSGTAELISISAPAAAGGAVPQGRTITTANGLLIAGTTSADLSADRTISVTSLSLDKEVPHSISVVASTTAATAGAALSNAAGAGSTSGAGGAWSGAGGAGGATGAGGVASITGGATSGVGGVATMVGGAGTAGNAAGGAAVGTGGAGQGSAAGGAATFAGGVGGATGAGGAGSLKGGAGGATSGAGGALNLAGGAGSGGNAVGGVATLDAGAPNGSGAEVMISIGSNHGLGISLAKPVGIGSAQALSGPGAVNVTTNLTKFTSTGVGDALTMANGLFTGQTKRVCHTVDGGSGVLTPASAGNFATATFTAVHDWADFYWNGASWDVTAYSGATIG